MGSTGRRPREPPARHLRRAGPVGGARDREQAQPLSPANRNGKARKKPGAGPFLPPLGPAGPVRRGGAPRRGGYRRKRRPRQLTKANHPPHNHPAEAGGERRNAPRRDADGPRRTGQGPTRRPGTRDTQAGTAKRQPTATEAAAEEAHWRRHPDARATQPLHDQIKTTS